MKRRIFTKEEIEKYQKYTNENILPLDEIEGRCHQCGEFLSEVELSDGPEKDVVCRSCIDNFIAEYERLEKLGVL